MAPFVTVQELSVWLGEEISADDGPRAEMLLNRASDLIRSDLGWHVSPSVTETITLDGWGGTLINLPTLYVSDIDSITVERVDGSDLVIDPGRYTWNQSGTVQIHYPSTPWWLSWTVEDVPVDANFPDRVASVRVALTHGYADAPSPLKTVVSDMCMMALSLPTGVAPGVTQASTGSISMSFDYRTALGRLRVDEFQRDYLSRYRVE